MHGKVVKGTHRICKGIVCKVETDDAGVLLKSGRENLQSPVGQLIVLWAPPWEVEGVPPQKKTEGQHSDKPETLTRPRRRPKRRYWSPGDIARYRRH